MPNPLAIPLGGLQGYRLLDRTLPQQVQIFDQSPDVQRELNYFLENAGSVATVDQLVTDRRLLGVVLGAFGLDEDINRQAFVRKVLEEGTVEPDAFANRLAEPAYREMSEFLGFGNVGSLLFSENVRLNIVDRYRDRQFEIAVGEQDLNLRLALNFKREAARIVEQSGSENSFWLRMIGTQSLRQVVEGAFFLPDQFAQIDLDQQIEEVKDRARGLFGSAEPSVLSDPDNVEKMIERFLLREEASGNAVSFSSGSTALTLLQSSGLGSGAQQSLFASSFL